MIGRRRLLPSEMFPAGDARFRVSTLHVESEVAGTIALRAVECGPPDTQSAVVCLHGWACSAYSYRNVLPLLSAAGIRAIALDLPGHGLSDKPANPATYTLDALSAILLQAYDALGLAQSVVVAHSMSGPLACRLAQHRGDSVASIVLLAPVGCGALAHVGPASAWTPQWVMGVLPSIVPHWIARIALKMSYGSLVPSLDDLDQYWAPSRSPGFVRALRELLHYYDWRAVEHGAIEPLPIPGVVLYGSEDRLVPERLALGYGRVFDRIQFDCVVGCGHAIPDEAPEIVTSTIVSVARC